MGFKEYSHVWKRKFNLTSLWKKTKQTQSWIALWLFAFVQKGSGSGCAIAGKKAKRQSQKKGFGPLLESCRGMDMESLGRLPMGQKNCDAIKTAGFVESPFRVVNVYTEFSGSTCAESAVESVVRNLLGNQRVQLNFKSMGDIKPTCRKVCMATRKGLRFLVSFFMHVFKF